MLSTLFECAASDNGSVGAAGDAGAVYEWVDESGVKHASDAVPEKYKGVATRIDPSRSRISPGEQEEAIRRAEALKAATANLGVQPLPTDTAPPSSAVEADGRTTRVPTASECDAQRRRFADSQNCFFGYVKPNGSSGYRSCVNEPVPEPDPACGTGDQR